MGQHLGFSKAANSLRRLLDNRGIEPETCKYFELVSYGPIFAEVGLTKGQIRDEQMILHKPARDQMAALEKRLRDGLDKAGYNVLNVVHSKMPLEEQLWEKVRAAFVAKFPKLV